MGKNFRYSLAQFPGGDRPNPGYVCHARPQRGIAPQALLRENMLE